MKKIILVVGLITSSIGVVRADAIAGAAANSGSNSVAVAAPVIAPVISNTLNSGSVAGVTSVVNNNPTNTNTVGSTAGVTLENGAVGANASTGPSSAQNGNMTVQTGATNITFAAAEAPKSPPPAAPLPFAVASVPQLIGPLSGTTNERGINLALLYRDACPTKAVRGYDTKPRAYDGQSGDTRIVFVPHINYAKSLENPTPNPSGHGPAVWHSIQKVQEVTPLLNEMGRYKCLGIMTVTAKDKDAGEVPYSVVEADASNFPMDKMEGFPNIVLLSSSDVISATKGVDNSGSGFGLGGGASKFFDPILGTLGVSASSSSGVSFPATKIGATFLVLVEDVDGVVIDLTQKKPEPVTVTETKPQSVVPVIVVLAESKAEGKTDTMVVPKVEPVTVPPPPKHHVKKKVAKKRVSKSPSSALSVYCKDNSCTITGVKPVTQ
jgi:hypothetical protein